MHNYAVQVDLVVVAGTHSLRSLRAPLLDLCCIFATSAWADYKSRQQFIKTSGRKLCAKTIQKHSEKSQQNGQKTGNKPGQKVRT